MEEAACVRELSVLYHSADYLVINKHYDIRIDSKLQSDHNTVQKQLNLHYPHLTDPHTHYGFRFCHQLDYSTSGALCVALNRAAAGRAYRRFRDRHVTKAYLALVRGTVTDSRMKLDVAIGVNTTEGRTHMMCVEGAEGCENPKPSQSLVTVLEYGTYDGDPVTKVLLQPLTGRTHQLRVHCSSVSHPIVGDVTYSLGADSAPYRMMLHAHFLRIPLEEELIQVTAPDPFLPHLDPRWIPQRQVEHTESVITQILTQTQQEERQREEEMRREREEAEERRRRSRMRRKEESDEERALCQLWLSEWNLENL